MSSASSPNKRQLEQREDVSSNNSVLNTPQTKKQKLPDSSISNSPAPLANISQIPSDATLFSPSPSGTVSNQQQTSAVPSSSTNTPAVPTITATPADSTGIILPQASNTTTTKATDSNTLDDKALDDNEDDKGLTKPTAPADPDKLSDALISAGIDVKAEEALLNERSSKSKTDPNLNKPTIKITPFLDERQLAAFMHKVLQVNGFKNQDLETDPQLLQLMTYACEDWMKGIVTNAVVLSRHRRRAIKNNKKRSELSKALRDISVNHKAQEDRRQARKKDSGIDLDNKGQDQDATQHIATNATVAMMTGKKSKKYSWMTGGAGGAGGSSAKTGNEGAIRFREAREESGLAVRDLLGALDGKRIGVEKTLVKGYAKLKD
ncbi:hypothetical protein WICPIJ_007520 [Wickerhamomyces pijperi]|uniref:Transcription initiation factor TFIID subunit 4 n=1 Tax=Wickerhamomyces pijperi TaxID=599730 RepID=A0A9P8Q2F8_WICPI|nr:hypothetical protein WICPIJ_007520 [Wickerhamomyces pijperi]